MDKETYSAVLHGPLNLKHRCFSTSTPFNDILKRNGNEKSMSGELFDSGLGSSISESVIAEKSSFEQSAVCRSPHSTRTACSPSPTNTPDVTITHSPIFSRNRGLNHAEDSLDISNIPFNRTRRLFRRKLNLDLDIEEDSIYKVENEISSDKRCELINVTLADDIQTLSVIQTSNSISTPSTASAIEQNILNLDKLLDIYSPPEADRLIGRKMGRKHVDILSELHHRNIASTSTILSYLQPEDLCSFCMVNRAWQSICVGDSKANRRRQKYIKLCKRKDREMQKENAGMKPQRSEQRHLTTVLQALTTIQPAVPIKLDPDRGKSTTTEEFMEAAKTLQNDEKLHKCPRCRKPAKVPPVQQRGKCQNGECGFDYCIKCLGEFHGSKPCAPLKSKRTKTDSIGTKKSKKNLKRL